MGSSPVAGVLVLEKFGIVIAIRNSSLSSFKINCLFEISVTNCTIVTYYWLFYWLQHCNSFWLWRCPWSFKNGHRVHCGLHQWYPQVNKSPAVVHTYQGLPPAVRRTRRWTLHYNAEMFNRLLMLTVIVCNSLAIKNTKKRPGLAHIKKSLIVLKWMPGFAACGERGLNKHRQVKKSFS